MRLERGSFMNLNRYDNGVFTIKNQILQIGSRTVNITNIDNMKLVTYDRYSLFSNVKEWLVGLVIVFVICAIWRKIDFLFTLYCLTIFALLYYNFKEHSKLFYGLEIRTNRDNFAICTNDINFRNDIHSTIVEAMNSKKGNYTINLDNRLINNGVISKGNKNTNKVNVEK